MIINGAKPAGTGTDTGDDSEFFLLLLLLLLLLTVDKFDTIDFDDIAIYHEDQLQLV